MWLARHLDQGSVVHSAAPNGCVDVRALVVGCVMLSKSAGENDGLHVSRYDDGGLLNMASGPQLSTTARTSLHFHSNGCWRGKRAKSRPADRGEPCACQILVTQRY